MSMAQTSPTVELSGDGNQGLHVGINHGIISNNQAHVTQSDMAEKSPPSSTVPFRRDPDFVFRDVFLGLFQKCAEAGSRTALVGLGGVGKSQLAIEHCYQMRDKYPNTSVFWVHASNPARFEDGYRKIAEKVRPLGWDDPKVDILSLVCNWLSDERSGQWTLVVDNADDLSIFTASCRSGSSSPVADTSEHIGERSRSLSPYLPLSSNGSILVTSRSREVALVLTGAEDDIITVEPMDESQANALFRKKLGGGHDEQPVAELLEALDYMPLAISQAAAYIRQRSPRISIARYLSNFHRGETDRAALLETDLQDPRRDQGASNSIIGTWRLSFEYLREQRPSAARLLSLMSFFDHQGIPEFMLHDQSDETEEIDHEFEADISTLRDYLLISLNLDLNQEGAIFSMHRLVQFSTRKWLDLVGEAETWKERYIAKMYTAIPDNDFRDLTRSRAWFPHAEIALSYRPASPDYLVRWTEVLVQGSWYAESQYNYSIAEKMAQEAIKWAEPALGSENPTTLDAVNQLAFVYYRQGRYSEAEEMHRRVLDGRMSLLGEDDVDTLLTFNCLAIVLKDQGKYAAAEEMNRRALRGYGKVLGTEHPDYLSTMSKLALVLQKQGKHKEIEEIHRHVLGSRLKELGHDHPDTIASMNNLASTLKYQGKFDEAEEMYRKALDGYGNALGIDHLYTMTCMNNLASVLLDQKKYGETDIMNQTALDEAEIMNQTALDKHEQILGKEHPDTLRSMHCMASLLKCQEKYKAAEALLRRAIEGMRKVLGEQHPLTLISIGDLGSLLRIQGMLEEAEVLTKSALDESAQILGKEHPETLKIMHSMALLLGCQEKYEAAEEMYRRAIDGMREVLGERHPYTLGSISDLASLLRVQGKQEEADNITHQYEMRHASSTEKTTQEIKGTMRNHKPLRLVLMIYCIALGVVWSIDWSRRFDAPST